MRLHIATRLALIVSAIALFALGVFASSLLGMFPERTFDSRPVATISLDLSAQVASLQQALSRLNASLEQRIRQVNVLEEDLVGARQENKGSNGVSEALIEKLGTALQEARNRNGALATRIETLERNRDSTQRATLTNDETVETLRRELAGVIQERDALQQKFNAEIVRLRDSLDRSDREMEALRRKVAEMEIRAEAEDSAAPPENARPAEVPPPIVQSETPVAETSAENSGTVSDGVAAYQAADYAGAFKVWRPLAEGGDARAQFHLGALYFEGRGVARDMTKAHRWLGRSASAGYRPAGALLQRVEDELRSSGTANR